MQIGMVMPDNGPYRASAADLAELREIAEQLHWMPAEWLEHRYDTINAMRRVAGRIRAVAARIERAPAPAAVRSARFAMLAARERKELDDRRRRARELRRRPRGQGELQL